MSHRKTVCVDLDGVLTDYSKGWQGVEHIGEPIPGAVEFTKQLAQRYEVVIYTTRCKAVMPFDDPDRRALLARHEHIRTEADLAKYLAGIVRAWLDRHGFAYHSIDIGQGKPIAAAYVDDRAVNCQPQKFGPGCFDNALVDVGWLCGG